MNLNNTKFLIASLLAVFILCQLNLAAQDTTARIYDPGADAMKDIRIAIDKAGKENKHVLIQVGGNWCPWCLKLHSFISAQSQLDSLIKADYIFVYVNYSKENKNPEAMSFLQFPQRFGFPVLVILDGNGKRIHTQDTSYLEKDNSYDADKIKNFLLNWNYRAVQGKTYR